MKKVIKGKLYDTETASFQGAYSNMADVRNFYWYTEELYKKKTGEFFLYGSGNAASKYSVSVGQNEWSGTERITPLSEADAKTWAEKNLDGEDYIEIFGNPEDPDQKETLNLYISKAAKAKLEQLCREAGISRSAVIEDLISRA